MKPRIIEWGPALLLLVILMYVTGCTAISTAEIGPQGATCTHSTDIRGSELAEVIGSIGDAIPGTMALTAEQQAAMADCWCEATASEARAGCGGRDDDEN